MKHLSIILTVFLFLGCVNAAVYGETFNPYPPPRSTSVNGVGSASQVRSGPDGEAIVGDLFLVRPFSILAYLVGIGMAVVATPFTLASGTTYQVYDKLLNEPFDHAFQRPLGEFPSSQYSMP
jgi:hypothetical protein